MIAGMTSAERLFEQVVADPAVARCVTIIGPGGCGKSALLSALAASYRHAAIEVIEVAGSLNEDVAPDAAVFLDDAHLVEPAVLDRLRPLATAPCSRLFVALRPWPRSFELTTVIDAIRQRGHEVRLGHLQRDAVAHRAATALEVQPSSTVVDLLYEETGGLPLLVDETLDAWRLEPALLAAPALPAAVIERVRQVLDSADPVVRAVLHAMAVGCDLDPESAGAILDMDISVAAEAIAAARSSGLLLPDGRSVPLAAAAVLRSARPELTQSMRARLLRLRHQQQRDPVPLARQLARAGLQDGFVADLLTSAGDALRPQDPAGALDLYADAVKAGAAPSSLALRRAESAARSGRFDLALQLVDPVLANASGVDFAAGIEIAAAVLAHRGQLERAGELFEWLGRQQRGASTPMAAIALLGTGRERHAPPLQGGMPDPTLAGGGCVLMARGLQESIDGEAATALSTLMRSTALLESAERTTLLPDTPAALAALIAIHSGDLDTANSALTRAIEQDLGGAAAWARHRLLLAWVAMLNGHYGRARRLRDGVTAGAGDGGLSLRDDVFARALELGTARRTSDVAGLVAAWNTGRDVLLRHPVDLFMLLPLGEFSVAASRLGQWERVRAHLDDAWDLLRRLGDPIVWSPMLRWCGVQAAILRNRPDEVEPHAAALVRAAQHSPFAAALAAGGRAWMQVLSGDVVAEQIEPAALRLRDFGLAWDGSRLLGQAAVHSSDRHVIAALLQSARTLQQPDEPADEASDGARPPVGPAAVLSAREQEVAELLVQRRTYNEIGQQLYISPKTVEHHVARIKQRVGATDRADLLARLRAFVTPPSP